MECFMFRSSIMLLATMLCVSCVSHRPIQDSSSPPIDAANPLDGTPAVSYTHLTLPTIEPV